MGHHDLIKLFEIKAWIKEFNQVHQTSFKFIVDVDTQEGKTRIMIDQYGYYQRAITITKQEANDFKKKGYEMFVPDLIEFDKMLIIEYQEEPKMRKGAYLAIKGHDELSDLDKDAAYKRAHFKQLKIWESSKTQKQDLFQFLDN